MKQLVIMRPIDFAAIGANSGGSGQVNLLSPDPKEAWLTPSIVRPSMRLPFSSPRIIDTIHVGFMDVDSTAFVDFYTYTNADGTGETLAGQYVIIRQPFDVRPQHAFIRLASPTVALGVRVAIQQPVARSATVGVVTAGLALQPFWGKEYGAGRFVWDTGIKERLLSGGFGIWEGARGPGYAWTFAELTDEETDALFALAVDVGETRSVLVIENPDTIEPGLNERIHWGTLDRIEQYDRFAPGATRWAFKIQDWA